MAIRVETGEAPATVAAPVRALVRAALTRERRRAAEIGVVLADDTLLRSLNRSWRRIDRATDVLSFHYDQDEPDAGRRRIHGDLVVSLDRVRAQAKRYRVSEGRELARLVLHGALHLCGHDHVRAAERTAMRAAEDRLLARAGAPIRALDRAFAVRRAR